MRLLKTSCCLSDDATLEIVERWGAEIPVYAIMSHLWSRDADDEVSFADVQRKAYSSKAGFAKVTLALDRARRDGFEYLWIDTCCIDKTSSAELSEAINSMFRYYHESAICYVYLADVHSLDVDFETSRWWLRGWTLQELIAPVRVEFLSASWQSLGFKEALAASISQITGIDQRYLLHEESFRSASIAKRMSWAAKRQTTREEDMAYCLMGMFDVNMSMLYGEGEKKAFLRLQEEILRSHEDHSIFAWVDSSRGSNDECGLLAEAPRYFESTGDIYSYAGLSGKDFLPSMTARGLHLSLPLAPHREDTHLAVLNCPVPGQANGDYLTVYLRRVKNTGACEQYTRTRPGELGFCETPGSPSAIYIRQSAGVAAKAIYPLHLFLLQRLRVADGDNVYHIFTHYPESNSLALPHMKWMMKDAMWCFARRFHKVAKAAGVLATVVRVHRLRDKKSFLLLLGSGSDALTVGFDAIELHETRPPFSHLETTFKPRAMGEWVKLRQHSVRVLVQERVYDTMKIYETTIEVEPRVRESVNPDTVPRSKASVLKKLLRSG
jgi:hypothetical protein